MISVTILTKNSSRYIKQVLEALGAFPEVAILDTGSTDETLEIAKNFKNVVIYKHEFEGFGKAHNLISSLATHDWILSLDSDEIVSLEFCKEVLSLTLNPRSVYTISRHNYYRQRFIKGCGWYPDRVTRLYNRKTTQFSDAFVHEKVLSDGFTITPILSPVYHYPYNSIDDFLNKMQLYSTLFAKEKAQKTKSSLLKAISHGLFAFFKSYFLKRGILLGGEGFEISAYNAITAYYKYLKLRDRNELF
jgi:glycosyltransferase involved in cell wall biosynthesis